MFALYDEILFKSVIPDIANDASPVGLEGPLKGDKFSNEGNERLGLTCEEAEKVSIEKE
jgi:hypothetical protein